MPKWWATSWTTVMRTCVDDLVLGGAVGEGGQPEDRDPVGHDQARCRTGVALGQRARPRSGRAAARRGARPPRRPRRCRSGGRAPRGCRRGRRPPAPRTVGGHVDHRQAVGTGRPIVHPAWTAAALLDDLDDVAAPGGDHPGPSAGDPGAGRLGQDPGAHPAHRLPGGHRGRPTPRHVLALTFTRKAAGELRDRLRAVGLRDGRGRRHVPRRGLGAAARPLARRGPGRPRPCSTRKGRLLGEVLGRGAARTIAELATEIEWAKARLVGPGGYVEAATAARRRPPAPAERIAELYGAYEEEKQQRRLVDFDDLLRLCSHAARDRPGVRRRAALAVPPPLRRRVPGRQPAADPAARRLAGRPLRPVRGRRPPPGHLRVERGRRRLPRGASAAATRRRRSSPSTATTARRPRCWRRRPPCWPPPGVPTAPVRPGAGRRHAAPADPPPDRPRRGPGHRPRRPRRAGPRARRGRPRPCWSAPTPSCRCWPRRCGCRRPPPGAGRGRPAGPARGARRRSTCSRRSDRLLLGRARRPRALADDTDAPSWASTATTDGRRPRPGGPAAPTTSCGSTRRRSSRGFLAWLAATLQAEGGDGRPTRSRWPPSTPPRAWSGRSCTWRGSRTASSPSPTPAPDTTARGGPAALRGHDPGRGRAALHLGGPARTSAARSSTAASRPGSPPWPRHSGPGPTGPAATGRPPTGAATWPTSGPCWPKPPPPPGRPPREPWPPCTPGGRRPPVPPGSSPRRSLTTTCSRPSPPGAPRSPDELAGIPGMGPLLAARVADGVLSALASEPA